MACSRFDRSTGVLAGVVVLAIVAATSARAATHASPAQKCDAAKRAAAGKDVACRIACTAKAAIKGLPPDDPTLLACLAKCDTRFSTAFARAEKKGGCPTTGDAAKVEAHLATLLSSLEETTYQQVDWGIPSIASNTLLQEFDNVYAATFGVVTGGATSGFTMSFTDAESVMAYLPAIGPPGPLNGSVLNPISTPAGAFGGDVLALHLNVDFSDARVLGALARPFGDLALCNVGTLPLNGTTVRQFLGIIDTLLGGGSNGYRIADLDPVTQQLNTSFEGGVPQPFAQDHLVTGACVCPSAAIGCNGACVDPATDAANCGSCGIVCGTNEVCSGGSCSCEAPKALCGTQCNLRACPCVDLQTDASNCGTCGHSCASHVCSGGVCQ
jgi:hypothetical protein